MQPQSNIKGYKFLCKKYYSEWEKNNNNDNNKEKNTNWIKQSKIKVCEAARKMSICVEHQIVLCVQLECEMKTKCFAHATTPKWFLR